MGDPRESATENKPPGVSWVRVKRCGKSAPPAQQWDGHGKPRREQDRIGTVRRQCFGMGDRRVSALMPSGLVA